jgi:hypothetical protein
VAVGPQEKRPFTRYREKHASRSWGTSQTSDSGHIQNPAHRMHHPGSGNRGSAAIRLALDSQPKDAKAFIMI